jgi:biotin carboxyl carrier protein
MFRIRLFSSTVPPMRYFVSLDPAGPPAEVDVEELPSGALSVRVGGKPIDVDVATLRSAMSIRVGGKVVDLTTEGTPPELGAIASGHRSYVRVESERMRSAAAAQKTGGGASDRLIKSPMPGRVVKILVAAGDDVAVGQPVVVVEAMKMENELKAKIAGKVTDVHVAVGATVESNAKLVTLG